MKSCPSLNINYLENKCELCEIGKKYDNNKSYLFFYHSLFNGYRSKTISIAELGIKTGESLLTWNDYFKNTTLYGFDSNKSIIEKFEKKYKHENIHLSLIDQSTFSKTNETYDIIIDNSTYRIEDQIQMIEYAHHYLKPGGVLVVENIFKKYKESDYLNILGDSLTHFQSYYFITIKCTSSEEDNKLFVLVKKGECIFKNKNKVTIITPCCRPRNLVKLRDSIDFSYVHAWIIVYDKTKIYKLPNVFGAENNDKIKEYIHHGAGISGNPQRNRALDRITNKNTFLYYLDDDNLIHPNLYYLLDVIDKDHIYSFNQIDRLKGGTLKLGSIDTAMFLIDHDLCKGLKWDRRNYNADGVYIEECDRLNPRKHIYVDNDLCFYNKLI